MIEQLDPMVRMIAVGAGLMLIAQLAAGSMRPAIRISALGLIVALVADLVAAPAPAAPSDPAPALASLAAQSAPLWLWLFARTMFAREAPRRLILTVALVLVAAWVADSFIPATGRIGFFAGKLVALILVADLVRVGMTGRDGETAPGAVRLWLPGLALAQTGLITTAEIAAFPFRILPGLQLFGSVATLTLIVFTGLALFRAEPDTGRDRTGTG